MASVVTYTDARARLAPLMDAVVNDREPVIITRRGAEDVALIAADELSSLLETAHLLRSPANARRLQRAYDRAMKREGDPTTLQALEEQLGRG
jgi:antitoxin YefM